MFSGAWVSPRYFLSICCLSVAVLWKGGAKHRVQKAALVVFIRRPAVQLARLAVQGPATEARRPSTFAARCVERHRPGFSQHDLNPTCRPPAGQRGRHPRAPGRLPSPGRSLHEQHLGRSPAQRACRHMQGRRQHQMQPAHIYKAYLQGAVPLRQTGAAPLATLLTQRMPP